MSTLQTARARRELDARLDQIRESTATPPARGWLRAVRDVLEMPARHMAERLDVTPAAIYGLERSEQAGTIRLDTLRRAADALGCDLVYALVPRASLQAVIEDAARQAVEQDLRSVSQSMALELQQLDPAELARRADENVRERLRSGNIWT
ncbi:MAG TPA: mobile mystery protein A [Ilumatobacter sp.]|nr:mobile mystery protein A [Ilumatobacter sp.]